MFIITNEAEKRLVEKDGQSLKPILTTDKFVTMEAEMSHLKNINYQNYPDNLILAIRFESDDYFEWINLRKAGTGYKVDIIVPYCNKCDNCSVTTFEIKNFLGAHMSKMGVNVGMLSYNEEDTSLFLSVSKIIGKEQNAQESVKQFVSDYLAVQKEHAESIEICQMD
jgi:hypothetical protein